MLFPNLTIEIVKLARNPVCITCTIWPIEAGRMLWQVQFRRKQPVSIRDLSAPVIQARHTRHPSAGPVCLVRRLRGTGPAHEVPHDCSEFRRSSCVTIRRWWKVSSTARNECGKSRDAGLSGQEAGRGHAHPPISDSSCPAVSGRSLYPL